MDRGGRQHDTAAESGATLDSFERRKRSNSRLKSEGVPVMEQVPMLEGESQVKCRGQEEVLHRALALMVVALKGEGLEQSIIDQLAIKFCLDRHFTPDEKEFLIDSAPTMHDRVQ